MSSFLARRLEVLRDTLFGAAMTTLSTACPCSIAMAEMAIGDWPRYSRAGLYHRNDGELHPTLGPS